MNLLWGLCPLIAAMYKINDIVRLDLMKKNYQTLIAEKDKAKLLRECFRVSLDLRKLLIERVVGVLNSLEGQPYN